MFENNDNNFEVITFQSMIFSITTFYGLIAVGIDVFTSHSLLLWLIIIAISTILHFFGFFIQHISKLYVTVISIYLFVTSIFVSKYLLYEYGKYLIPQIVLLGFYVLSVILLFWKILQISAFKDRNDVPIFNSKKLVHVSRLSRKDRKSRRRNNSRKKLGNSIKSGKYRGWWTGF